MNGGYWHVCGQTWENTDAPAYRGPHVCSLPFSHDGEHVCACGARREVSA